MPALAYLGRDFCSVVAKRQRRHYREGDEGLGLEAGRRKISLKEAGRCMLDALKPSPLDVVLTLNDTTKDCKCLGCAIGRCLFVYSEGF